MVTTGSKGSVLTINFLSVTIGLIDAAPFPAPDLPIQPVHLSGSHSQQPVPVAVLAGQLERLSVEVVDARLTALPLVPLPEAESSHEHALLMLVYFDGALHAQ